MSTKASIGRDEVADAVADWPDKLVRLADRMTDRYGTPEEATEHRLIWCDAGLWQRAELYRDGLPRDVQNEQTNHVQLALDHQTASDLVEMVTPLDDIDVTISVTLEEEIKSDSS